MGSKVGADDRDEQFAPQVEQSWVHSDSAIMNQSAPLYIDTFLIIIYHMARNYKSYFQLARRNLIFPGGFSAKNRFFCVYLWQNRKDLAKIADGTSLIYKAVCTYKLTAHIPRSSPGCFEKILPPRVWSRVGGAAVRCRLPPTDTALAYYVRETAPSRSLYISSAARRAFATGVSVCGKQ